MEEKEKNSRTSSSRTGSAGRDGIRQRSAAKRKAAAGTKGSRRPPNRQTERRRPERGRPEDRRAEARRPVRKPQSKRRRKRNLGIKIALLIILVIAAVVGAFLWKRYSPSDEEYDRNAYFGIEQEGQLAITVDNQVVEPLGMIADGKAYIQYEIVRDHINSRFYWDPNENTLLYTLPTDMVSVEVGSKDYSVSNEKQSEDYVILRTDGSTAYIALDFIQQYTNIDYEVYDDPSRVMIVTDWGETTVAEVRRDTQVRYQGGVKSPILTQISKGDEVTIVEREENWKKVRTKDGFIGYVKNSALRDEETKEISRDFEEQEFTNISKDYTINMVWHNVSNMTANTYIQQSLAGTEGLNTIAPTWFSIADTDGNLESIASTDYVSYAHQSGLEVWAVLRDFHGGTNSYDETYQVLSYTSKRERLISQVIQAALAADVDGINLDFELISSECGPHYIQFVRELSVECRANGLVFSVDNYVPQPYNQHYDIEEQGIVADYVIIMAYDEHTDASYESGSVASISYLQNGIADALESVPQDRLIAGIPFFTRLWLETPKTEEELAQEAGTEAASYPNKISSQAMGMDEAAQAVTDAGAQTSWDEETKQNYAEWEADGGTYKIWLEDTDSLEEKLKVIDENELAGVAEWSLGMENQAVWNLIGSYMN